MGLWDDVKVAFGVLVATVAVTPQLAHRPVPEIADSASNTRDREILQNVSDAVSAAERAANLVGKIPNRSNLVPLALRDGLGVVRVVTIEQSSLTQILQLARQLGRSPILLAGFSATGEAISAIDLALQFSDPDVFQGMATLARAIGDRAAARRGESRVWNANEQRALDRIEY